MRMFLGTPRYWWIAAALPLVGAFALLLTGGSLVVGVLLLLLAMVLFGMAPMRYGQRPVTPSPPAPPVAEAPSSSIPDVNPPEPRPTIPGRDAAEV
jgi:hypothetical protein